MLLCYRKWILFNPFQLFMKFIIWYIFIITSTIKCHKKDDGDALRCFKCGQGNFPSCTYFNGSEVFVTICPKDQKSCLKGWVNGSGGSSGDKKSEHEGKQTNIIRSCAPIAENICLNQNAGGACTCSQSLCNSCSFLHSQISTLKILLPLLICINLW